MIQLYVILCFLLGKLNSGYIYSLDMVPKYSNAQWLENLQLNFNLESGLTRKEFIEIKSPFYLGLQPKAKLWEFNTETIIDGCSLLDVCSI